MIETQLLQLIIAHVCSKRSRFSAMLVLVGLMMSASALRAQQPVSVQITERDGLPSSTVYDIFQDSLGYIWLGTDIGLVRYNSSSFKHYKDAQRPTGAITALKADRFGRIWFINFNSEIMFLDGDSIVRPLFESFSQASHFEIIQNTGYIYGGDQIFRFAIPKKIPTKPSETPIPIDNLLPVKRNILPAFRNYVDKVGYIDGSHVLNQLSDSEIRKIPHLNQGKANVSADWDSRITILNDRVIVNGYYNDYLYEYRSGEYRFLNIEQLQNPVRSVHLTADSLLWISDNNEIVVTNLNYQPMLKKPMLEGNYVTDVMLDQDGKYWVSTLNNGLYVFPNLDMIQYTTTNSDIADSRVQKLELGKNNDVFIGFPKAKISYKSNGKDGFKSIDLKGEQEVQAIFYMDDCDQMLVCATSTFQTNYELTQSKSIDRKTHKDFVKDGDGVLWSAASHAAYAHVPAKDTVRFKKFKRVHELNYECMEQPYYLYEIRNGRSRTIEYHQKENAIYIGFGDDLMRFDIGNATLTPIRNQGNRIIAKDMVFVGDTLFVGTVGSGLTQINADGTMRNYNSENAPVFDYINALESDKTGLWMGTGSGLFYFDLRTEKWHSFKRADGLLSNEINDLLKVGSDLWIGTPAGLQILPIGSATRKIKPLIHIEAIRTLRDDRILESLDDLSYDQSDVSIQNTALRFPFNKDEFIEYRLVGQSDLWTTIPASQERINFLGLAPGKFRFEIRPRNDNDSVQTLSFQIHPPFWKTGWFLLIVSILSILTILLLLRYWVYTQNQQSNLIVKAAQLASELRQSELAGIKSQMNPHFIFNALNSVQGYFLEDDKEKANEILGKFSDLMRRILKQSQVDRISLQEEIESLELYLDLEKVRMGPDFKYSIEINKPDEAEEYTIPSMIIQPFVENAIKHGLMHQKGVKELKLDFTIIASHIEVKIDDNGIGRKQSELINLKRNLKHQSFAISANRKRLELLNQNEGQNIALNIIDKEDDQGNSFGTLIILNIPLNHESTH